jgi:putative addiction module killer protein
MQDDPVTEILEYLTTDGRNPFRDWLSNLRDRQARSKVRVRLNRVRMGNLGDSRSVGGGVSELRIPYGPGYRVYYGRRGDAVVILLCGGDKGSQKRDIFQAQRNWEDYQSRAS